MICLAIYYHLVMNSKIYIYIYLTILLISIPRSSSDRIKGDQYSQKMGTTIHFKYKVGDLDSIKCSDSFMSRI